jgi:hypothetical protein
VTETLSLHAADVGLEIEFVAPEFIDANPAIGEGPAREGHWRAILEIRSWGLQSQYEPILDPRHSSIGNLEKARDERVWEGQIGVV